MSMRMTGFLKFPVPLNTYSIHKFLVFIVNCGTKKIQTHTRTERETNSEAETRRNKEKKGMA